MTSNNSNQLLSSNNDQTIYKLIKYRKCIFPEWLEYNSQNIEESVCTCGYKKREHHKHIRELNEIEEIKTSEISWNRNQNTGEFDSDAFGEIEFPSRPTHQQRSKFLKLDFNTNHDGIDKVMEELWQLIQKPSAAQSNEVQDNSSSSKLFLAVIGNCHSSKLHFLDGIVETAMQTKSLIFTNGYNKGCARLLGEKMRAKRSLTDDNRNLELNLIGLSHWEMLAGKEILTNQKSITVKKYPSRKDLNRMKKKDEEILEPNHTHFLMVSDGCCRKGITDNFKKFLTDKIINTNKYLNDLLVLVAFDEKLDTIKTINMALSKKIPCILIQSSSKYVELRNDLISLEKQSKSSKSVQKERLEKINSFIAEADSSDEYKNLENKLVRDYYLESFRSNFLDSLPSKNDYFKSIEASGEKNDLKNSILDFYFSIFKAKMKTDKLTDLLGTALKWNCHQVAVEHFFNENCDQFIDEENFVKKIKFLLRKSFNIHSIT